MIFIVLNMPAKRKTNKKSTAGKKSSKKVKLDVRIGKKSFQDLPMEKQVEPLGLEPKHKEVFQNQEQKNSYLDKNLKSDFVKKQKKNHSKAKKPNKDFRKKESNNFESIEKSKNMIMRFGVAFFMILIMAAWLFNFKKSFVKLESENKSESINWSEITDEFSESISQMKQELDEAKSAAKESALTDTATGTEENLSISQEEINELKARLEKLESKEKQATNTEEDLPLSN